MRPNTIEVPPSTQAVRPQRVSTSRILSIATGLEKDLKLAGAEGNGLHQLIGSIALPACIRRAARAIASIRNKTVHDSRFNLSQELPDDFWDLVEEVSQWLHLAKKHEGLKISDLSVSKVPAKKAATKAAKKTVRRTAKKAVKKVATRKK